MWKSYNNMDYESNNYFYWFYAGSYSLTISRIVCCWFRFCQPQFASKKMKSVGPSIDSVRTWTFLWRIKVTMLRSLELFRSRMKAPWASTPAFSFRVQHQGRRVGKLCPPARRLHFVWALRNSWCGLRSNISHRRVPEDFNVLSTAPCWPFVVPPIRGSTEQPRPFDNLRHPHPWLQADIQQNVRLSEPHLVWTLLVSTAVHPHSIASLCRQQAFCEEQSVLHPKVSVGEPR